MKTLNSSGSTNLKNENVSIYLVLWAKLIVLDILAIALLVLALGVISKVSAQTGLEVSFAQLEAKSKNVHLASFSPYLTKAERLPSFINSSFKEVGPLVSPDGKTLFFSRQNHPENTGGVLDFEDIWYSTRNEITGNWSAP